MNTPKADTSKNLIALKGRTPPSNLDLEEAIAGSVLFDPNAILRLCDTLKPSHFYFSQYGNVYAAALSLHQDGKPTDLTSVAVWLRDRGLLEKVGGQTFLIQTLDSVFSTANIDHYANVLMKKWRRRETIRICREIASLAHDESIDDDSLQNDVEKVLLDLFVEDGKRSLRPLSEFVKEEIHRVKEISSGAAVPGISTGFYELDAKIIGLQPGELTIVAGRPGSGKTAVSGAIAANVAAQGKPVAIFSLEMGGGQIAQRMIAAKSSIDSYQLRSGRISQAEWEKLNEASDELSSMPVWVDPSQSITVNHIRSEARRLIAEKGEVGAIVIDYLHLMLDGSEEDVREIGKITRQLKKLSIELNTSIVLLSQLNRAVESRQDKRPIMSDLRSSGAIEQDADIILMLYRDDYYNENSPDKGVAEVNVVKNRNGVTGTVKLLFEPQFSRFRNVGGDRPIPKKPQPKTEVQPVSQKIDTSELTVDDAVFEIRTVLQLRSESVKEPIVAELEALPLRTLCAAWSEFTDEEKLQFLEIGQPETMNVVQAVSGLKTVIAMNSAIAKGWLKEQLKTLPEQEKTMAWKTLTEEERRRFNEIESSLPSPSHEAISTAESPSAAKAVLPVITEHEGFKVGDRVELTLDQLGSAGIKEWLKTQRDIRGLKGEISGFRKSRSGSSLVASVLLDDGTTEDVLVSFVNHFE